MIDVFHGIGLCEKDPVSVFEAIERMAADCCTVDDAVTPYKVDKVFWLICSGNYYKEKTPIQIKGHKKDHRPYKRLCKMSSFYFCRVCRKCVDFSLIFDL